MKYFLLFAAVCVIDICTATAQTSLCSSEDAYNCFAVIAGKNATSDGSVLLAHNEDDRGEQMLNLYVVPHTDSTLKYLWAEFPGMEVADAFLNEYGVGIVSNSCPSKEDVKDFTDGGILYEVRTSAAKYAKSARDAVRILGKLVEERGYRGSGRTYSIADCNEAWIFSAVQGRHWVAQRVPDDCVMALPNNYIIDYVDLSDTANFAGSADIIEYAIKRGWYNPERDGQFSFKKAYSKPTSYTSSRNVIRHLCALQYLTGNTYSPDPDTFELFAKPNRKISLADMVQILSCHGENTPHFSPDSNRKHQECICVDRTVVSTIFQLRNNLPVEIGAVMWVCAGRPCVEAFVPWYSGMSKAPDGFGRFATAQEAIERHFSDATQMRENWPDAATWKFVQRWETLMLNYDAVADNMKKTTSAFQKDLYMRQPQFEKSLRKLYHVPSLKIKDYKTLEKKLNDYTAKLYKEYVRP